MISYNDKNFVIGKEEYPPYAAELHYFRVDKRYWSICFERIRKAGFRIISTVVPWNLHEDDNRQFDFSGFSDPKRDLIVFVELVREFGFKLILRPGPWIFSEYTLNGVPTFLEKYPEVFARDINGELIRSVNRANVSPCYYPSIGNPRFLNFVRHYLNGLTEIIKNYVYPRGPLFLIELDSENYYGGHFDPHMSDYNEQVVEEVYPNWLESRYEDIKSLNKIYGAKYKEFNNVEPPKEFDNLPANDMARVFDWFRFKEYLINNYINELREMYKTFSCEPMFMKTLAFKDNILAPATGCVLPPEGCLKTVSVSWDRSTGENLCRARYLRTVSDFPFATELPLGNWSYKPQRSKEYYPIDADATRYITTVAYAGGVKGGTYHMFTGRDHWYGSALEEDGTINDTYEIIKTFNENAQRVELSSFEPIAPIGLAAYTPHIWESILNFHEKNPSIAKHLATITFPKMARDLDMLKFDYGIPDLGSAKSIDLYDTLIIPISEAMGEKEQQHIVDLAQAGKNLILVGVIPQYDLSMQPCTILSKALKCKSQKEYQVGLLTTDSIEFTSMVFGSLKTTEKRARKIVSNGRKTVGLAFSKFKGNVFVLSFDVASEANHHKMSFIDSLFESCKLKRFVDTSNPRIRAVIHKNEKDLLLFIMNSNPQQPFREEAVELTRAAIQIDLKALGFKSTRVRMTELFSNETINTTANQLASGYYLTLNRLDGRIYHITRR